jgi:hypothetical protein
LTRAANDMLHRAVEAHPSALARSRPCRPPTRRRRPRSWSAR